MKVEDSPLNVVQILSIFQGNLLFEFYFLKKPIKAAQAATSTPSSFSIVDVSGTLRFFWRQDGSLLGMGDVARYFEKKIII